MKLFLFDLDGTLVTTGGAGLRALAKTFDQLFGIKNAMDAINPSGKTDPAIFREMVRVHLRRDIEPGETDQIAGSYLAHLELEMRVTANQKTLKGVVEFLEILMERKDSVVALGTGNLEKGARLKLTPMGLNRFFKFGGFGSDAEDRADVLKWGHRRAEQFTGASFRKESVYVIGDTLLDVAAARRAGFQAVAVASGGVSKDELASSRPDYLWQDMTDGFEFLKRWDDGNTR